MTKVINSPCAASRARVVCSRHTHTGISNNACLSDHAHVRARAKRRPFTEAEVAAWRERIFGETLNDPVKVAVEEATRDFGSAKDFTLWAWYANRIGVNNFLELYFEQKSIMRDCRRALCARGLLYRQGRVQRRGHENVPVLRNFRRAD